MKMAVCRGDLHRLQAPRPGCRWGGALLAGVGLAVALLSRPARAQVPDLVEVGAQYLPEASLQDPRPAKTQVSSYDAAVNLPWVLGETTFLVPGLAYHVDSISYADAPVGFQELRAFHSLDLTLLFVQLLGAEWAVSLRVAPGLAGDFARIDSGMLRLNAVALLSYSASDQLVLGGGGLTGFSFGSLLALPAAYVDWKPSPRWRLEAFVPAFIHLKLALGSRFEIGVRAEVAGNSYAVRDARIRESWPCAAAPTDDPLSAPDERIPRPSDCFDHLAYSVGAAGLVGGARLFESVWLTLFAGHTFYRRLEQMNEDDERIPGGLQDIPDVPMLRASITWRVPGQ
jgi:uncharacterized protein DUF6268